MQCAEFEDRLNAVLDQRQRPEWDAQLRGHMERCPLCHETARGYRAMLDGFCVLAAPEPPAEMAARVLGELRPPAFARAARDGRLGHGRGRAGGDRAAVARGVIARAGARAACIVGWAQPGLGERADGVANVFAGAVAVDGRGSAARARIRTWPRKRVKAWPASCCTCPAWAGRAEAFWPPTIRAPAGKRAGPAR